jgi:hypothetical protein
MALSDAENCQSAAVTEPATCQPQPVACRPTVSVKSNRGHIPYSNLIKFNQLVLHQSAVEISSWVRRNYNV